MAGRTTYISISICLLLGFAACEALEVRTIRDEADVTPPRDTDPSGRDAITIGDTPTPSDTETDPSADSEGDLLADTIDAEADTTDAEADTTDPEPDIAPYGGPPIIDRLFPEIVLSDGLFYIDGQFLARPPNDISDTDVVILTEDAELGEITIATGIITGTPSRLVIAAPRDLHEQLRGRGMVVVTTPEGTAEYRSVFATNDATFSGKTEPGAGLLGNVYRLHSGTPALPNLDDPCSDPNVINTEEMPCPFTSILLENVNIPQRSWDTGFPGLLADVDEWFAIRFDGFIQIAETGSYAFQVCSDDGSRLWIGPDDSRVRVVDNDGQHSMSCADGRLDLTEGRHAVQLDYFQGPRTEIGLVLTWQPPGSDGWTVVPPEVVHLFELDEL
jgi:hypothetical protein